MAYANKRDSDDYKKHTGSNSWTIVSRAEAGEGVQKPDNERLETSHIGNLPQSGTLKWNGNGYSYVETWIRFDFSVLVDCEE
jgi:hypothetical protein